MNITLVIVKKIIFFVSIVFIAWKVVPWIMKMLVPLRVTEALISAALIICFSFSYYSEMMGIAGIIGAFAQELLFLKQSISMRWNIKLNRLLMQYLFQYSS